VPSTTFEYGQADELGYLVGVRNSIGGRITYQYENTSKLTGVLADREFEAVAPGGPWQSLTSTWLVTMW